MLREGTLRAFAKCDFLYTPAATGPAPKGHGSGDNVMNAPFATMGLPSSTFNIGLVPETQLPLGAQLGAKPLDEVGIIRASAWCEGVLGRQPMPMVAAGIAAGV